MSPPLYERGPPSGTGHCGHLLVPVICRRCHLTVVHQGHVLLWIGGSVDICCWPPRYRYLPLPSDEGICGGAKLVFTPHRTNVAKLQSVRLLIVAAKDDCSCWGKTQVFPRHLCSSSPQIQTNVFVKCCEDLSSVKLVCIYVMCIWSVKFSVHHSNWWKGRY